MIRDWNEHSLHMDFSNIETSPGKPSDVDMWYISKSNFLIIGEIKKQPRWYTAKCYCKQFEGGDDEQQN